MLASGGCVARNATRIGAEKGHRAADGTLERQRIEDEQVVGLLANDMLGEIRQRVALQQQAQAARGVSIIRFVIPLRSVSWLYGLRKISAPQLCSSQSWSASKRSRDGARTTAPPTHDLSAEVV